jgi:hypothetical protein
MEQLGSHWTITEHTFLMYFLRNKVEISYLTIITFMFLSGTKRAHNILFQKSSFIIRRITVLGKFKDPAIILDAIRRSLFPKPVTAAIFTSVRVDFGRPPISSSSASFLPSRNQEYHLKSFDRFRSSFPQAFYTNTSVSVADRPSLKQNFMATLCSFPPSMAYKENRLYKISYNSYTVKDKQMKLGE